MWMFLKLKPPTQPNLNKALGTLVLSFRYDDTTHYDVIMLLSNHVAMS